MRIKYYSEKPTTNSLLEKKLDHTWKTAYQLKEECKSRSIKAIHNSITYLKSKGVKIERREDLIGHKRTVFYRLEMPNCTPDYKYPCMIDKDVMTRCYHKRKCHLGSKCDAI